MDLSIILPAIRTHRWPAFLQSLELACQEYEYEVVLVGPFEPPSECIWLQSFAQPSVCGQLGVLNARGEFIFLTVDDGVLNEHSIDRALDLIRSLDHKDVVNMRYTENGDHMPPEYWTAAHHGDLRLPGVAVGWKISVQPLMRRGWFLKLGGWDCQFEYLVHPCHDLMFRIQADGGRLVDSPMECCVADWMPGTSGDHAPIHHAQIDHDEPLFRSIYQDPEAASKRKKIPLENHLYQPQFWNRRFQKGPPRSYEELL